MYDVNFQTFWAHGDNISSGANVLYVSTGSSQSRYLKVFKGYSHWSLHVACPSNIVGKLRPVFFPVWSRRRHPRHLFIWSEPVALISRNHLKPPPT